jgi:hypothetical protein
MAKLASELDGVNRASEATGQPMTEHGPGAARSSLRLERRSAPSEIARRQCSKCGQRSCRATRP